MHHCLSEYSSDDKRTGQSDEGYDDDAPAELLDGPDVTSQAQPYERQLQEAEQHDVHPVDQTDECFGERREGGADDRGDTQYPDAGRNRRDPACQLERYRGQSQEEGGAEQLPRFECTGADRIEHKPEHPRTGIDEQ